MVCGFVPHMLADSGYLLGVEIDLEELEERKRVGVSGGRGRTMSLGAGSVGSARDVRKVALRGGGKEREREQEKGGEEEGGEGSEEEDE